MQFDVKEIITAFLVLFAVIDIIGSIPVIIDLRAKVGSIQSEKATIACLVIMVSFLFIGESILTLIGITVSSFAVAGAFILFFIALEMILGISLYRHESAQSASIVPLAFPLIAGAGTLTTLISLRSEYHVENIVIATIANLIVVYVVLKFSTLIEKILGQQGLSVLRRIFGVILLALSVKLFASNVGGLF